MCITQTQICTSTCMLPIGRLPGVKPQLHHKGRKGPHLLPHFPTATQSCLSQRRTPRSNDFIRPLHETVAARPGWTARTMQNIKVVHPLRPERSPTFCCREYLSCSSAARSPSAPWPLRLNSNWLHIFILVLSLSASHPHHITLNWPRKKTT